MRGRAKPRPPGRARRVYLRFSAVKARFRSVSTYLEHFSTALGLAMKGLLSTRFLWISAPFFVHRFTSVTPDISLPCVPPNIATRRASSTRTVPLNEDMSARRASAETRRCRGLRAQTTGKVSGRVLHGPSRHRLNARRGCALT